MGRWGLLFSYLYNIGLSSGLFSELIHKKEDIFLLLNRYICHELLNIASINGKSLCMKHSTEVQTPVILFSEVRLFNSIFWFFRQIGAGFVESFILVFIYLFLSTFSYCERALSLMTRTNKYCYGLAMGSKRYQIFQLYFCLNGISV